MNQSPLDHGDRVSHEASCLPDAAPESAAFQEGRVAQIAARLTVGRAVLSAPWEVAQIRTFRTSADARGALGTARLPPNRLSNASLRRLLRRGRGCLQGQTAGAVEAGIAAQL
jgi:hypothetical protein